MRHSENMKNVLNKLPKELKMEKKSLIASLFVPLIISHPDTIKKI